MIPLSPTLIGAAGAAILVVVLGVAVKIQSSRLDAAKAEHAAFVAKVETLGKEAETKALAIEAENKLRKEKADAEHDKAKRDLAGVYDAYRRLREQRADSGTVPVVPTFTPSANRTCFDSQELVGSIRGLEAGILRIIQQGDQAIGDLKSARDWAQTK